MPSKHSKSSGKSQHPAFHDIFPNILSNNTSDADSIISGMFTGGWPPLGYNDNNNNSTHQNTQTHDNDSNANEKMEAIKAMIQSSKEEDGVSMKDLEDLLTYEMARVVYGSNYVERVGLGFEETMELCLKIFRGEKMDNMSGMNSSHLEVINHANAFLYLLEHLVIKKQPLTENAIKETHSILCNNLSASDAGVLSSKSWGGVYRSISANEKAFAGAHEFTKPPEIPKAMKSLVSNLQADIENLQNIRVSKSEPPTGKLSHSNIWHLAAKYCERFVQIHPFRDGNGRTCRLILNVILIRFAGVAVAIGMNESERDAYLFCAQESGRVGGNVEGLGKIVAENGAETLERWRASLVKLRRYVELKGREDSIK